MNIFFLSDESEKGFRSVATDQLSDNSLAILYYCRIEGPKCWVRFGRLTLRSVDTSVRCHLPVINRSKCCSVSPSRSSNGPKTFFRLIWQKKIFLFLRLSVNWSNCWSIAPGRSSNGPKTFYWLIWQKKNIYFSGLVSTNRNVGQSQLDEVATDRWSHV